MGECVERRGARNLPMNEKHTPTFRLFSATEVFQKYRKSKLFNFKRQENRKGPLVKLHENVAIKEGRQWNIVDEAAYQG